MSERTETASSLSAYVWGQPIDVVTKHFYVSSAERVRAEALRATASGRRREQADDRTRSFHTGTSAS